MVTAVSTDTLVREPWRDRLQPRPGGDHRPADDAADQVQEA
jgi:hypothetical protein